jgi:hypothetical protein
MIRWYKGVYKVRRVSGVGPLGKAEYVALEDGPPGHWKTGDTVVCPVRLCWRRPKSRLVQARLGGGKR